MALPIKKKTQIKTDRLILRPYSEQDIGTLIDLLTDPAVTSTFMVPEMESRSCAEELVRKLIGFSQPDDTKHLEYGIYLNEKMIGFIKHRLTRAHREKQLKMSCQALHNAPPNRT